ncbi:hypothetical protein CEE37_09475 [candidate division LCP-89 bacterium B3_LCP]|uniref:Nucleoside phosphorylase domain-containing protein n=1 Tax=candidate division LCP-89 bacterium B3_LCP TaxID=2012998 RepID=A0A532UYY0_UNCL8|nr:MAG: hypothetical protein CEE37_09475 [candidate division LCP-89 bacterium B3_LCP]
MIYSNESSSIERVIDVGIITIVPTEVEALFNTLAIVRNAYEPVSSPLQYWRTSYRSTSSGRALSIIVSILGGEAGNTEVAIATSYFLRDWYPKLVCLVGIAAGTPGKTRIADVVMPNKVHDRTIKVFENGVYRVRGRTYARNDTIDRMLKILPLTGDHFLPALNLAVKDDIAHAVEIARERYLPSSQFDGRPRIIDGSIASDNVLIRDPAYFNGILDSTDEKCRAGEMESAGFVLACQRERIDFPWLVVRGISDFGDSAKDDSFQLLAAKAACTALKLFIEKTLTIDALPLNPRALRSTSTLEFNLVRQLRDAFAAKRWKEVCRIGAVISRPLWLSGNTMLRYEIGELVENAAAFSNNTPLRAMALIDDLGWTAIKLGKEAQAEKHILDGIRLAKESADNYFVAKGYRHLASLYRQKSNITVAESYLANARDATSRITDQEQRGEMDSALLVSTAKLQMESLHYPEAINLLQQALDSFKKSNDLEREVKIYALLAHCSEKLGKPKEAEKFYLTGQTKAREAGRFDEFSQNTQGLILLLPKGDLARCKSLAQEVYDFAITNGLWDAARIWREKYDLSDSPKKA